VKRKGEGGHNKIFGGICREGESCLARVFSASESLTLGLKF
jgi:hypothetical protein